MRQRNVLDNTIIRKCAHITFDDKRGIGVAIDCKDDDIFLFSIPLMVETNAGCSAWRQWAADAPGTERNLLSR